MAELVFLMPGRQVGQVRRQTAELLCRRLGGYVTLIDEVCALRGLQDQLAVHAPDDPRRLFGTVEASSCTGAQLASLFSTMNQRLTNQETLLARIHERLEQEQQRVRTVTEQEQ